MRVKKESWVKILGSSGRNNRQIFEHIRLEPTTEAIH